MGFLSGIVYNLRGFWFGIRNPKLLMLGSIRFLVMVLLTILFAGLILTYHQDVLSLLWARPESQWFLWLWHVLSWILLLLLLAVSALLSYLLAQILFGVLIMDAMSRVTERIVTGRESQPLKRSLFKQMGYMIFQEIPRTLLPVLLSLSLMIFGWLTPLGPIISLASALMTAVLMAWDNTDIIPARHLVPFRERLHFLRRNLSFHLGFGLCFLIPLLNVLLLSFAPVGATLYHIDLRQRKAIH